MPSLTRIAEKLQGKKYQVSKLKRKTERELKKAKILQRRSTSGLASIEKRVESAREQLTDVSGVLTQKLAQQESVQRLLAAAEVRLNREKEAKEQAEQEIEFAESSEEKENAQTALNSILDTINDITFEIRQRKNMSKKVTGAIDEFNKSKSKISTNIHNQIQGKPGLQKLIKKSKKSSERFAKQFTSKIKQEEIAKKSLKKVRVKLEELQEKRRKLAAKRAALKRKLAARRAKRKATKKPKRKTSKPKRKTSKPKRKTSKPKRKTSKPKRKTSKPKRKAAKKAKRR